MRGIRSSVGEWVRIRAPNCTIIPKYQTCSWGDKLTTHCVCVCVLVVQKMLVWVASGLARPVSQYAARILADALHKHINGLFAFKRYESCARSVCLHIQKAKTFVLKHWLTTLWMKDQSLWPSNFVNSCALCCPQTYTLSSCCKIRNELPGLKTH